MQQKVGYARTVVLRRIAGLFVVALAALVAGSLSPACRTPTQVTLELRTTGALTCAQLKGVAIVVASDPQKAEERMRLDSLSAEVLRGQCGSDPRLLGTLVLTPSDSSGAVIVRARISDLPEATCKPPLYLGCIVARRAFAFIDHASVTLPISLEIGCLDVPCDVVSSCRSGTCVSSQASCSESSERCDSEAEPKFERDGGPIPVPPDAQVLADGGPDGEASADASSDGSTDAPADSTTEDAPTDAPADVDTSQKTNLCPTVFGPMDCVTAGAGAAPLCCIIPGDGGYSCQSTGQCMGKRFICVGAKHCGMAGSPYCCATGELQPASDCASDACASAKFYCSTQADCPTGKVCTGIDDASVTPDPGGKFFLKVCQ